MSNSLSTSHPGGCFVGFNAAIDRKAAEQIVHIVNEVYKQGFSEVNLCLSSVGGILDHTYYAFNIIDALPIGVITWNIGNVQSAANILFLLGQQRFATPGSTFFFHQAGYDPPTGRVTEPYLKERLKAAQYEDSRSADIVATKTGRSAEDVRGWQNTELVMDTAQAIAHGIIHAVRPLSIPANALFHQILI